MGNWTYSYDALNRLTAAQNTATTGVSTRFANAYGCWTYDGFGNRTKEAYSNTTSTPCANVANDNLQLTVTTTTASNQITGFTYDLAGNVLYDNPNYYRYDAEGRLCAVQYPNGSGGWLYSQYLYDASGTRIGKGTLSALPSTCNAPTTANGFALNLEYLLGLGGEQVTELNASGVVQHTNVFDGGKLQATYDFTGTSGNGLHFHLADALGTKRVQATPTGPGTGNTELSCMSLPFGNDLGNTRVTNCVGPGTDATEHHFTGKERDTESGNDYFGARYYASSMGRFLSPDWSVKASPVPYAKADNPQTLNLYAYVGNNPLGRIDKDGHYECSGSREQCAAIKTGLQVIKNAEANLKDGSSGKALLDRALKFYGAEGERNGVKINFSSTDTRSLGETSTEHGVTTISFGRDSLTRMGPTGKGETVVHEGTHGVDQHKDSAHPMPTTFWQFYDTEYHAYQAESAVDKGVGARSETDNPPVWEPGISKEQRTTSITQHAYSNAVLDCEFPGACQ